MSKEFFSKEEFKNRWEKVRSSMKKSDIELLMVISPTNINYLIGTPAKGYQEFEVLLFPIDSDPLVMFTRRTEVEMMKDYSLSDEIYSWGGQEPEDPIDALYKLMLKKNFLNKRIGIEVPYYYLHPFEYKKINEMLGNSIVNISTDLIGEIKLLKSETELNYVRKASKIADKSFKAGIEKIKPGITEREISATIHYEMFVNGGDIPSSPMNFLTGNRSMFAHGEPSDKKLESGDFMHLQFGAHYRRYCCTIGRNMCLGKPNQRMKEIFKVTKEAGDACIAEMGPGKQVKKAHDAAKSIIQAAGMEKYRLHMTGYAVGIAFPPTWVEPLIVDGSSERIFEPGMVIAVEPPVFSYDDKIGVRLIDNVIITNDGVEVLSKTSRELHIL
tara:strand:+ start:2440 stop:3594 length:1155 start_codon:yes stop_codon:yes gene_type:complete